MVLAPTSHAGVLAQLSVRDGVAAVEFYAEAFGAVEVYRVGGTPENRALVAQLSIDGASIGKPLGAWPPGT